MKNDGLDYSYVLLDYQVNGESIMNKNHHQVVEIIKVSTFVSLTLMRKLTDGDTKGTKLYKCTYVRMPILSNYNYYLG